MSVRKLPVIYKTLKKNHKRRILSVCHFHCRTAFLERYTSLETLSESFRANSKVSSLTNVDFGTDTTGPEYREADEHNAVGGGFEVSKADKPYCERASALSSEMTLGKYSEFCI